MIRTISPQDMREMERAFLEGTGYPSILLMEHAAQAVVDALSAYAKAESRVLFVCGNGNNGGDGCAAARLWMQRGGKAGVRAGVRVAGRAACRAGRAAHLPGRRAHLRQPVPGGPGAPHVPSLGGAAHSDKKYEAYRL